MNDMNMNGENVVNEVKPKKKTGLYIFIAILFLGLGICAGFMASKYLNKSDDNKTIKEEEKKEEEKVEEKVYKKPEADSKYKLLKEQNNILKFNKEEVNMLTYYYEDNEKNILKEVYVDEGRVLEPSEVYAYDKSDKNWNTDTYIDKDIDYVKRNNSFLNDSSSDDKYLVFYYRSNGFTGPEGDAWNQLRIMVFVVNKSGQVLYSTGTYNSFQSLAIYVDSKEEALDRTTYYQACEDPDDSPCDKFALYRGKEGEEDLEKGTYVEFFDDHFYSFEVDEDYNADDYKFEVVDGKLQKKLLGHYLRDKNVLVAGAE